MALADDKGTGFGAFGWTGMEAFEARRLMAIVPVGPAGVLAAMGVTAVETAAANSDGTNNFRYAGFLTGASAASVTPVTGPDSSTPGMTIALTVPGGGVVSNLDVAANTPSDRFVAVYEVTTTTVTPPGPGNPGGTTVDSDVYAALYVNGNLVGQPNRVNTTTAGNQTDCRVAMDGSGNFVVVWQSTTSGAALVGRRFTADGSANGGEFTLSTVGVEPDVAANASGAFITVFNVASGNQQGTFAQLYNANGTANGTALPVSAETFSEPTVGLANNGRFVVAWAQGSGAARRVVAQRYSPGGSAQGAQFAASVDQTLAQTTPELAVDTAGGFALGYAQASTGTTYDSLGFRVFRANGNPAADETVVSGVQFDADHRFGLAYRIPGLIHVAYADTTGAALMQTYQDDTNAGGTGNETPAPAGAAVIDGSAVVPSVIIVTQDNTNFYANVNGVISTFARASFTSLYITGSTGNDTIRISNAITAPSIVYARAGADTVFGGSGNDVIDGGDGGTVQTTDPVTGFITNTPTGNAIQARAGDDYVYGGSSNDTVFGGGGNDRLLGGPGLNLVYGEAGNDTLLGGNRGDALFGADGNDRLEGNDGGDYFDGGAGNDSMYGGEGNDRLNGSNGNDLMFGDGGADVLHGGRGSDSLYGGDGRDTLFGDANADILRGGGIGNGFGFPGNGGGGGFNNGTQLDIVYYDLLDVVQGESTRLQVP